LSPRNHFQYLPSQQESELNENQQKTLSQESANCICQSRRSDVAIFDELTGETICSKCAAVISDKQAQFNDDSMLKKELGRPTSLIFPDKGLSTVITSSNTDSYGTLLNKGQISSQISSITKIRYCDRLLGSKTNITNLRGAFAIMAALEDKLTLTDPVMERAAYYYLKTLENKLVKGRDIKEMVLASVYAACKEMDVPRRLEDISKATDADNIFSRSCFRMTPRELSINSSNLDANRFLSKVAE
jgi:transcription initiation factor TFIIB